MTTKKQNASAWIQVRVTPEEKARLQRLAKRFDLNLSRFIVNTCMAIVRREERIERGGKP